MPVVHRIIEEKYIYDYLNKRGLVKQYQKAKNYLLVGNQLQVKFKEREPKGNAVWYFRINKQYRALGFLYESGVFLVVKIDNHQ